MTSNLCAYSNTEFIFHKMKIGAVIYFNNWSKYIPKLKTILK